MKTKRNLIQICLLWAALLPAAVQAQFTYDGFTFTTNNSTITITAYTGPGGAVTIPSNIVVSAVSLPVTSIGRSAFYDCTSLTSVTIADSVTSIRDDAFDRCSSLTSVTIPNNVTNIGEEAFGGCSSLTNVTIPASDTSIGEFAFADCSNLTAVTVDPGNPAYSSVAGVLFNKSQTTLIQCPGAEAGTYAVPNSVTDIWENAFAECFSLTNVTIPNRVISIGVNAFYYCSSLTSVLIPNSVTNIGEGAFARCMNLTAITVDTGNPAYSSVAGVLFNKNQRTLIECPGAKAGSYLIPNSVTNIGEWAFFYCTNLSNITIPNSVTGLGNLAFAYCFSLTNVTIPNSVTCIGDGAFQDCFSLTSVTIPNRVISIGEDAFYYCSKLTSVMIPNSVTSIGDYAFGYCAHLTNITIPTRVTNIADGTFWSCTNLSNITIPNSVTSIGEDAFWYCPSLTSVTIPASVTSIGDGAFEDCSSLTSVTIPNRVTNIGEEAFVACYSLTSITIPASVTNIGYEAFAWCTSLTYATIHGNAPSADSSIFYYDPSATVYYYAGTSGWGSTFGGAPAVMLNPPNSAGSLQVTLTPVWAVNAGAQWQVDGGIPQPGGATVLGLSATNHTVSFTAISGCAKPANQTVTIIAGQTNHLVGAYSDTTRPTLSITNVTAGMNVSNAAFTVKGKCGDHAAVTNVLVSVNQGAWNPAALANQNRNWLAPVSLKPGTNMIAAFAVDAFGNVSTTNTVKLIYLLRAPLSVQIVGEGVLTHDYNGDLLDIGENYTMQAKGTNGFAFYYWGGGVPMTTNTTLTFTMAANLTIIAHFADVTKPVVTTTYPIANQKWSNSVITATGKASDNVGVTEVEVQINNGGWVTADTVNHFTNWTAENLPVQFGTNILQAYAVDGAGNVSVTNEIKFIGDLNPLAGMALIPAGTFTMGDTLDGEVDALPTNVTVSAFYMDTNLVSYSQWQTVYAYATDHGYNFTNAGWGTAANHPVLSVDWYDVVKWCNARSAQAGLTPVYYTDAGFTQVFKNGDDGTTVCANWRANGYRLPTEAEWEKAARGGLSGQRFPWGNTISESQANYYADPGTYAYDLGPYFGFNTNFDSGGEPYTSPVGYFAPNGYGLNDMAGNLFEWCWDWYAAPTDPGSPYLGGTDPRGPVGPLTFRVQRGGSWYTDADFAPCAYRGYSYPYNGYWHYGFRCVRGL